MQTAETSGAPEHANDRAPALELIAPIGQRGLRHHHQVGTRHVAELVQIAHD